METESATQTQTSEIHERVSAQFGAAASAYSTSLVHSDPSALGRIIELADPKPADLALDIVTGAGHTALALVPHVAEVVAYDVTEAMLAETGRNAASRGLKNVQTRLGRAESLPFPDASFDIVTVRLAPHHFADVRGAVREMARAAKLGGRVIVVDSVAPEDDSVDREWNEMETLRDPSHVRNYRPSEWREFVEIAGLRLTSEEFSFAKENGGPMDFAAWVQRMNTPVSAVVELRRRFVEASPALAAALSIRIIDDAISFCVPLFTIASVRDSIAL